MYVCWCVYVQNKMDARTDTKVYYVHKMLFLNLLQCMYLHVFFVYIYGLCVCVCVWAANVHMYEWTGGGAPGVYKILP